MNQIILYMVIRTAGNMKDQESHLDQDITGHYE